jgi:hypothetical protein
MEAQMLLEMWQGCRTVNEPKQPDNKHWQSANALCKQFVCGRNRVPAALKTLRSTLTREIYEQMGVSWEEAAAIVEHNLIKRQEPGGKPGPKAFNVADDAVRLLPLESKAEKERRRNRQPRRDASPPGR